MKEEIIAGLDNIKIDIAKSVLEELEIQKNCKKMLPKIKEYFSQALDQYADWKMKELHKQRILKKFGSEDAKRQYFMQKQRECRARKKLSNKDKIK